MKGCGGAVPPGVGAAGDELVAAFPDDFVSRGRRIFATMLPDELHVNVLVAEDVTAPMIAASPEVYSPSVG